MSTCSHRYILDGQGSVLPSCSRCGEDAVDIIKDLQAEAERLRVFETYVLHTDPDTYRKLKAKVEGGDRK